MFIKFNEMFRANGTELCVVMLWLKGEYRRFWCANIFLYLSQSLVKGQRIICKEFLSPIHITTDHLISLFSKSRVPALTFHYALSPNKFISCWLKAIIFVIWRKFDQYLSNCWCRKFKRGTQNFLVCAPVRHTSFRLNWSSRDQVNQHWEEQCTTPVNCFCLLQSCKRVRDLALGHF